MKAASASCNYYYFHVRQKQRTTLLTQQQQQRHHQHHHLHRKDVRTYAEGKSKRRNGFAQELLRKEEEEEKDEEFKNNTRTQETERCVCGATSSYSNCCKQFHDGTKYPNDPVTLMRSRFSAYAKGKAKYIVETTHSDNQIKKDGTKTSDGIVVSTLEADVRATCEKIEFYNLSIKNDKKKSETEHFVAFEYKCRVRGQKGFDRGREENHTELSTFRIGEDGKWYFLDGIQGA